MADATTATTQTTMTVTNDVPLIVIADGAETACAAASAVDAVYSIGDRVQVTLRDPQIPLVTGTVNETEGV